MYIHILSICIYFPPKPFRSQGDWKKQAGGIFFLVFMCGLGAPARVLTDQRNRSGL